jgi:TRAP-type C4-dicarboxylate transport system substrate-binding protein
MKRLSVLLSILVVVLLVISLVTSCTPKPEEAVLLRLGHTFPAGDEVCMHLDKLAEQFNEAAGGQYQMKHYPGEALVKVTETIPAVGTGAIEMTVTPIAVFTGLDPRFGPVPFSMNNIQANVAACKLILPLYSEILEEKFNQKAISCFTVDGLELISQRPVKTLEDWKGLLVAAIDPQCALIAEALGGSSVVTTWVEGYSVLEKGVVDAELQSVPGWLVMKLPDVANYGTLFYAVPTFIVITINLDIYNAMPENTQDMLVDLGQWSLQDMGEYYLAKHENDLDEIEALGMEIYTLPKEERDRWKEAYSPYAEEQLSQMGDFAQKLNQIADQVNSQFP